MGKYFDVSYMIHSFPALVGYVHVTLFITLVASLFGVILGCLIAVVRLNRVKIISQLLYPRNSLSGSTFPHLLRCAGNTESHGNLREKSPANALCTYCIHLVPCGVQLRNHAK